MQTMHFILERHPRQSIVIPYFPLILIRECLILLSQADMCFPPFRCSWRWSASCAGDFIRRSWPIRFFPAVFFPMVYLVFWQLGKRWFPKEKNAQGIFLLLTALLNWFAGYSIYNAGNFQMIRIWQGKALLAAALLPLLLYLCLNILMEKTPTYPWILLGAANLACCLLSSMGVLLAPLVTGCVLLLSLIRFRDGKKLVYGILCCGPNLVLGLAYLFIK